MSDAGLTNQCCTASNTGEFAHSNDYVNYKGLGLICGFCIAEQGCTVSAAACWERKREEMDSFFVSLASAGGIQTGTVTGTVSQGRGGPLSLAAVVTDIHTDNE